MTEKILIPLYGDEIAPRFDLATEVLIVSLDQGQSEFEEKIIVLPQASAEQLCHLVLTEGINTVICGGIEEEFYRYLTWKKVMVLDSVISDWKTALARRAANTLKAGDNTYHQQIDVQR